MLQVRRGKDIDLQVRKFRLRTDPCEDLVPIHERHFQIKQDHGGKVWDGCVCEATCEVFNRLNAVASTVDGIGNSRFFKRSHEQEYVVIPIVDDQDPLGLRFFGGGHCCVVRTQQSSE